MSGVSLLLLACLLPPAGWMAIVLQHGEMVHSTFSAGDLCGRREVPVGDALSIVWGPNEREGEGCTLEVEAQSESDMAAGQAG